MSRYLAAVVLTTLVAAPALRSQGDAAPTPQEQKLQNTVEELRDQLLRSREQLLEDVKVNGVQLDPRMVKREAVYLTGGKLVEAKVADFFILEEMEKQIATGRKPEEFLVTEDDILKELDGMRTEFEMKNPGVDFWDAVRAQYGLSRETFIQQRKQAVLFDRVFFPGSPSNWPQITKEAIIANTQSDQGAKFLEQLEQATQGVDEHGNPRKLPEFWVNMMRQFVQKGLRNWSDIKYGSHGLDPAYVISVNGRTWATDEAFEFVKQGLYVQDLERALTEVVVREVLRQLLEKEGAYVSDEEFHRRYEEYRQPYDTTPFTVEVIATRFKGFPCLEAFRARWRLITSYQNLIADEMDDKHLQAHADKFAAFFADGQVSIDMIPFIARDMKTGSWLPDGMDQAKARCEAALAALEKGPDNGGKSFDEILDRQGEFYANDEHKGRLGFKPLNQIRQQFRESEFTQLHDGYSISHYLFYDAEVGKTVGPLPGPDGYYIARVNARTPARRRIDVNIERERELVREDYVNYRFLEWAKGVLAKARVE